MKIQMIGHASIFVETQDSKILIDPVLFDPHAGGIEEIYPKQEIIYDKIPDFDLLVISHRHPDHFDIRSLAFLPKNIDVLIPHDKVLQDCLHKLGYSQVYCLEDFNEVKLGSTNILITRSEYRVPEFGILIADPSGVLWNQIDSDVSRKTVSYVKSKYAQIDLLIAPWQPLMETSYQNNKSLTFPYSRYKDILDPITFIKPKAIIPGSNGFKFINELSWLNQIAFPVTLEQFCKDVKTIYPEIVENIFTLEPGDTLILESTNFTYKERESNFINKLEEGRENVDFSPVNIGNNLIDYNPENYDIHVMKENIEEEICMNLPQFFKENITSLFIDHRHWEVIYQLKVIFPNCNQKWFFDFSEENIQAHLGRNPLANLFSIITASSLYGFIKGIKGWDYAHTAGNFRQFQKVYIATPHGVIQPPESLIKDPIELKFPYHEVFEKFQYQEIERWGQTNKNSKVTDETKTFMMKTGSTIVRLAKTNQIVDNKEINSTNNSQAFLIT